MGPCFARPILDEAVSTVATIIVAGEPHGPIWRAAPGRFRATVLGQVQATPEGSSRPEAGIRLVKFTVSFTAVSALSVTAAEPMLSAAYLSLSRVRFASQMDWPEEPLPPFERA